MTFRFRPARLLRPVLVLAALIIVSVSLNPQAWLESPLWVYAVISGSLLSFAVMAILLRRRSSLSLTDQGLTIETWPRPPRFHPWMDITGVSLQVRTFLAIPLLSAIRLRLRNGRDSFLAVFDPPPQQLAALIEEYRVRHGGPV